MNFSEFSQRTVNYTKKSGLQNLQFCQWIHREKKRYPFSADPGHLNVCNLHTRLKIDFLYDFQWKSKSCGTKNVCLIEIFENMWKKLNFPALRKSFVNFHLKILWIQWIQGIKNLSKVYYFSTYDPVFLILWSLEFVGSL